MPAHGTPKTILAVLSRASAAGLISVSRAAEAMGVTPSVASSRLARLARGGWVSRIKRGLYFVLPIEAEESGHTTPEDPWLMAESLYAPCYIAGWSAAEYWNLTEQIFRSTFVATAASIRKRDETRMGAAFHLAKVQRDRISDLALVWRGPNRVSISGPERTLVDAARDPGWVGGARSLAEMLSIYRERHDASEAALLAQLERHGNGAAAKRIGLIAEERWPEAQTLVAQCHALRTSGTIKLDPRVASRGPLATRWGLWRNVDVSAAEQGTVRVGAG